MKLSAYILVFIRSFVCLYSRYSPKTRKCRKLLYLEEKENGERSEQSDDSTTAVRLQSYKHNRLKNNDTNLARNKRLGRMRLFKQHGDQESSPRTSLLDVHSRQAKKLGISAVDLPHAEKPYCCSICNKQFKYYSNLKSHWEVIHKRNVDDLSEELRSSSAADWSDVSFQCEVCLRDFKYASNLRTHQLVHTGQDIQE